MRIGVIPETDLNIARLKSTIVLALATWVVCVAGCSNQQPDHDANATAQQAGALKQTGPWTGGVLANYVWSVAGDDDRQDTNLSFAQPFLDYTTKSAITFEITTETTYDWKSEQWSVPLVVTANKLIEVGNQLVIVGGGPRYWVASTDSDPEGWSVNVQIILLFPKE